MAPTGTSILTGIIINSCFALIGVLLFCFLRIWRKSQHYFDAKRDNPAVVNKPFPIANGFFSWIRPIWSYKESDVIKQCGLDAAIYLRLLSFCFELFCWVTPVCLAAILPTNITDDFVQSQMDNPDSSFKFSNFDKLSLANVNGRSQRMWVHMGTVYYVTIVTLMLLWRYSKESVLLRIQFMGNSMPGGSTHTVLVTDIPAVQEATNEGIKSRKEAEHAASKKAKKGDDSVPPAKDVEAGVEMSGTPTSPNTAASEVASPSRVKPDLKDGLRQRKVFEYDLSTTSLDPVYMAKQELASGTTPEGLVSKEFHLVYGDAVQEIQVIRNQAGLDKLVAEYEMRKQQLEDYLDGVADKQARGEALPPAKVTLLLPDAWCKERYGGGMIKKVDGLPFWRDRLAWLESQIAEQQAIAEHLIWPSAFVSFKTRVAQSVSATGLHHHDETTWVVRGAPEPNEVLWNNLGMTSSMRSSSSAVMWVLFWLMTMFYMIPIGMIQGLIDVPKYTKNIPGLNSFVNNIVIKKLIEAVVPGLVLKIFLAILPMILAAMVIKSGAVALSEVDFGVVSRFFIFQVIVVFLGSVLSSSFFSQAQQWINDPMSVVTVLGTAIPQSATFFVSYIWVNFGVLGLGMARIVGVILYWVFSWLASSPKAKARVYQEQYTSSGTSVTGHTLILLVGIVYSCINPIATGSALAYFALAMIVEKYNNIYVFRRRYESGGQMWVKLLNQVMTVLYIFQLTMIGLIAIKKFPYAPLIIPVIFPTIIFHNMVLKLFARPWTITSLHDAAELDENDKLLAVESGKDNELYLSPVFKVKAGQTAGLIKAAEDVEPRVAADIASRAAEAEAAKAAKKGRKDAPAAPAADSAA